MDESHEALIAESRRLIKESQELREIGRVRRGEPAPPSGDTNTAGPADREQVAEGPDGHG